jgi:uncharacterized repeat protein (TIGR03847 family)
MSSPYQQIEPVILIVVGESMPDEIDFHPVTHITTDAIGSIGKRVFYIQGWEEHRTVTVIVEKIQIQSLAIGLEQFLSEIQKRFPNLSEASGDFVEEQMHINPPVDPLFRVDELGLGYDSEKDLLVLVLRETLLEEQKPEDGRVVRLWCTRSQLKACCRWGMEVASRGRPICPQCGEPMDPARHFCPKKNGHKH